MQLLAQSSASNRQFAAPRVELAVVFIHRLMYTGVFLGIPDLAVEFAVGLEVQGHEYDKRKQAERDYQDARPAQL